MYRQALKVIYALLISAVLLIWLENKSINLYWEQTYHSENPFNYLDKFSFWAKGGELNNHLMAKEDTLITLVSEINAGVVNQLSPKNPIQQKPNEEFVKLASLTSDIANQESILDKTQYSVRNKTSGKVTLTQGNQVFYVGDSLMQGVAPHLRNALFKKYGIEGVDLSKQSTGLAYINYFNWPKLVEDTLTENPEIKLVIVYLGPNDPWDFPVEKGKPYLRFQSPEWEEVYRSRVKEIISSAKKHDASVIWLLPPNMKKKKLGNAMNYLSTLFEDEVKASKEIFIPTNEILGSSNDEYSNFVEVDGKKVKVRVDDGIHFTISGQKLIAEKVLSYIDVDKLETINP